MIEPVFDLWLRDGVQKSIELEVAEASRARRLELRGSEQRRGQRHEQRLRKPVSVRRLIESCASCREHGWRFACAKHNTAEEWESLWK